METTAKKQDLKKKQSGKKSRRFDTEAIKQAAAGNWPNIFNTLCSLPLDILDGQHHPCPKCEGTDRFRMLDENDGALYCNQCFKEKSGDGLAAIRWLTGCTFPEAIKKVTDHLGMDATKQTKKPKSKDPEKDLEFRQWSNNPAQFLIRKKPGLTEEAFLAAGARYAKYKNAYNVICLPIIGQKLDTSNPVGWAMFEFMGNDLPVWNKEGKIVRYKKVKLTFGSDAGLIGLHAIERLKTDEPPTVVWKVEGITDLLALWATIPEEQRNKHLVVTNSNGANENPKWQASFLAAHNVNVVHDADVPGQEGATTWTQAINLKQAAGKEVRNVQMPFEVVESKGEDLRDYLNDSKTYNDLLSLAEEAKPLESLKKEDGEIDYEKVEMIINQRIIKLLQIEILFEDENSRIRVFSTLLRKSSWIRNVDALKLGALIQIAGKPAQFHIDEEGDGETTFTIKEAIKAIADFASERRDKNDTRGIGVWQGRDERGNETQSILLVNNTEAAKWNEDETLERITAPRTDGLILDFGAGTGDWFDFETLNKNLKNAGEAKWCHDVIEQAFDLFKKWKWRHDEDEIDATLIVGLVLSSFVQTIWAWRPLVSITGESNSGKSFLFEALGGSDHRQGIFGSLAFKQAKSSKAGIRQGVGNTGKIILCDEFEKSKDRNAILQLFRNSSRGEKTAMGTTSQQGTETQLRHIGWVAAIEAGLNQQPDSNRFIQLELLKPTRSEHGKLILPDGSWFYDLGQKLLAIAVRHAIEAKNLAVELKRTMVDSIDARMVESYAVPAALLGIANGYDKDQTQQVLLDLLKGVEQAEQGGTDHDELLDSILTARIYCGPPDGSPTVSQIIEDYRSSSFASNWQKLEAVGLRLMEETNDLFIYHKQVTKDLLKGTEFEGKRLDQLLLRIKGVKRSKQRLAGRLVAGLVIPANKVNPIEVEAQ